MTALSNVRSGLMLLDTAVYRQSKAGADLNATVISISTDKFRILYVPKGREEFAKMELNEEIR